MADPKSTFLGLRTVVYHVEDLETATHWYTSVLGLDPYFETPYYVGFNVGGFELGLHPVESEKNTGASGSSVAYWGVPNAETELKRLIYLGATLRSEIQEVGEGIKVADVLDPFGNILGIIENPHFPNDAIPKVDSD
jgi:catechol 2,3-dioxygenase-like lactoylglutathione lyase family enzyme